jgi:hypothetical protein
LIFTKAFFPNFTAILTPPTTIVFTLLAHASIFEVNFRPFKASFILLPINLATWNLLGLALLYDNTKY